MIILLMSSYAYYTSLFVYVKHYFTIKIRFLGRTGTAGRPAVPEIQRRYGHRIISSYTARDISRIFSCPDSPFFRSSPKTQST